jgi:hypothetical protein
LYPILWAVDHAPVRDAEERAVLVALVIKGDFDGCNCFRSYGSLAEKARVDAKTAGRRCREMEARGILKRQTAHRSQAWLAIPEEQRPVVWEVMIPADWWSPAQLAELNEQRASLGRPPITPQNRPPLAPAPPKKTRSDKGSKRPKKGEQPEGETAGNPGTDSPHPPDYQSPPQGLRVPQPSETPSERPSEQTPAVADAVGSGAGGFAREGATSSAGEQTGQDEGGCAASDNPAPSTTTRSPRPRTYATKPRQEPPGFAMVRAAIPAAVARPGTRLYPGLHRAINDLLTGNAAAGIPSRTPEQVVARVNRRWFAEHAEERSAPGYRGCDRCTASGCQAPRRSEDHPEGCDRIKNRSAWLAAALLAQDCPDPACEDGQLIGAGACRACQQRHEERRAAAAAVQAAAASWRAQEAAKAKANSAVHAWINAEAAEEERIRATLAASGAYGVMLDHRVHQHMTGWRDRNPRPATPPQKPQAPVQGTFLIAVPGSAPQGAAAPHVPAQRPGKRTVVCTGCDQGHRTDADDDLCPACREGASA